MQPCPVTPEEAGTQGGSIHKVKATAEPRGEASSQAVCDSVSVSCGTFCPSRCLPVGRACLWRSGNPPGQPFLSRVPQGFSAVRPGTALRERLTCVVRTPSGFIITGTIPAPTGWTWGPLALGCLNASLESVQRAPLCRWHCPATCSDGVPASWHSIWEGGVRHGVELATQQQVVAQCTGQLRPWGSQEGAVGALRST